MGAPSAASGWRFGTAVVILDPSCPVSQRYFPVLARLEKTWRERGIGFLYVAASAAEDPTALRSLGSLDSLGLSVPIARENTSSTWR